MTRQYVERAVTLNQLRLNCDQLQHLLRKVQARVPTDRQFAALIDDVRADVGDHILYDFVLACTRAKNDLIQTQAFRHYSMSASARRYVRNEAMSYGKTAVRRSNTKGA